MIFNVEIDTLYNTENEKGHAYSEIKIGDSPIKWDSVTGYLELEKSYICVESLDRKIKASLYDSYDVTEATFKIEIDGVEEEIMITHNDLETITNLTNQSFIGALIYLVEKHVKQ